MKKTRLIRVAIIMLPQLLLFSLWSFCQTIIVQGTVTDDNRNPIVGVTVVVKGTITGTITDANGTYSIDNVPSDATLVFSFVGMQTQEIPVAGQGTINVTLAEEAVGLDEIVVIGYGSQRKATLTGSVANVSGEEIVKSPSSNVSSSLAGRLPGLIVSQRSGEPGRDDPEMLIRGTGTFDLDPDDDINSNAPLIIIDGVERSLMSRLNPEDIESFSVLKGASAAIYGARAANGVIIITTKKGKKGAPVFDFSYNSAFNSPTKVPEVLDAATFAEAFNEAKFYQVKMDSTKYKPFYTDSVIQLFRDGSNPILYPNTNWVKEIMKPYSIQQRINLQVTGGTDAIKYLLSFGALTQGQAYRNYPTEYEQYNMRAKIDVDLNNNLNVGANIYAILNYRTYPPGIEETWIYFYNILYANPTIPAKYPNGLIAPGRLGENPLCMDQRGTKKIEDAPLYSTFTATYKIPFIEGLKIDASFNYDLSNQFEKDLRLPYYYYEYNVNTGEYDKKQGTGASTVELTDTYHKWTTMLFNYKIVYDKTFLKKHHVTAMVGQEQQKNTYQTAWAYRKNFVSSAIDQIDVGSTDPEDKNNGGSASASSYNNYFGRFNYDFNSKYLVEFLFRYDGSQIFPEGKRYGFFPGISGAWRLSEEEFIHNSLPFMNQLKLRFSYGEVGNDRIKPYQYLQSFLFGDNYVFGSSDVPGIYAGVMPNPNVTWEVAKKTDVGLETSMWNGLFGMELTFWKEKRSNILLPKGRSIPVTLGFSGLPDENIGEVDNSGYELVLRHRNTLSKLVYNIEANLSYANSKVVFMDETPHSEPYQDQTGHPLGAQLYYQADGIFNTQEELDSYPYAIGTKLGDIKILDLNGDSIINSDDQFRFDYNATPKYVFGLQMNFQYRNIDLSMFFQGQTKAYNYENDFTRLGNNAFDNVVTARAEDRWTIDNPDGTMPRSNAFQPGNTTFYLFDATFVRLKTIELGYSIPENIASKIRMKNVRFYVSAFNLLTWAKEIKWADPEMSGELTYYPQQRTINLGINVKF
ncbi:MAG: TonB-dependent receptor [Bacteroidales bacterium]|nr:TonB-dependent receptor [Bacteroidales bacterium]